ncbi:MAG: hypothetical protein ACTHK0_14555 [Ginsengibacter sp.]
MVVTHSTSGTVKNKFYEIADSIDPSQKPDSVSLSGMKVTIVGNTGIVTGIGFELGGGPAFYRIGTEPIYSQILS